MTVDIDANLIYFELESAGDEIANSFSTFGNCIRPMRKSKTGKNNYGVYVRKDSLFRVD